MKAGNIFENRKFLLILGLLTSVLVVVAIVVIRGAIRRKRAKKVAVIIESAKMNPNVQVDKQGFVDVKSLQGGGGKPILDESKAIEMSKKLVKDIEGCIPIDANDSLWKVFLDLPESDFTMVTRLANKYIKENGVKNCYTKVDSFYEMIKVETGVWKTDFRTFKAGIQARMEKLGL